MTHKTTMEDAIKLERRTKWLGEVRARWDEELGKGAAAHGFLLDAYKDRVVDICEEIRSLQEGMANCSVDAKLTRILHLLEGRNITRYRFSEAHMDKWQAARRAMRQLSLVGDTYGSLPSAWPEGYSSYSFTAYQWPCEVYEKNDSAELQEHFEREVAKLGVLLGEGGYQVHDVSGQDSLSFRCCSAKATLAFDGGTDAVVTPFGASRESQFCAVLDWKTPLSLRFEDDNLHQEMQLELLGAMYHSHRPALVTFTDLNNFIIYQAYGKAIQYYHTFETPDAGRISTSDAMRLIAHHLTEVSSKEPIFHFQQLESVPKDSELGHMAAPLLVAKKLARSVRGIWWSH